MQWMEFRDNNVYTDTALSDFLLCAASSESHLVNFTHISQLPSPVLLPCYINYNCCHTQYKK